MSIMLPRIDESATDSRSPNSSTEGLRSLIADFSAVVVVVTPLVDVEVVGIWIVADQDL